MNNKIKEISLIGILAGILFVLEQALVFLPNIQLTVFLIILYSKKLGFKRSIIIIILYVLLDNLVIGSFNIIFTPFMFIGWAIIPLTLCTVFKRIENNIISVNENMETTIPGLFACGDCTGGLLQISKAIYEGTKAGLCVNGDGEN